jgi:regulator of sigma E protease
VSYLIAIAGLLLLVLIHELGHFSGAKATGMWAMRFSIGFPPFVFRRRRGETEYTLGAIPLGGYVKIPGMLRPEADDLYAVDDVLLRNEDLPTAAAAALGESADITRGHLRAGRWDSARDSIGGVREALAATGDALSARDRGRVAKNLDRVEESLDPRAYWRSSRIRRLIVILAGPATNIVACFLILAVVAVIGRPEGYIVPTVHAVFAKTPAASSGLRAGDRLVSINGVHGSVNRLRQAIEGSDGHVVHVVVRRDGKTVALKPVHSKLVDGSYKLGFEFNARVIERSHPIWQAPGLAWGDMSRLTTGTISAIGNVVTPAGRSQLHSVVGIVSVSADEVHYGAGYYLTILADVSLALAIFNLLPFLPLDGGHVLMILLEKLRGRMVSRATFERVSVVGIALMALLFVTGLHNDIGQLISTPSP